MIKKYNKKWFALILLIIISLFFLSPQETKKIEILKTEKETERGKELAYAEDEKVEITSKLDKPIYKTVDLVAVGDAMFHMPQVYSAYNEKEGKFDFSNNFKFIKNYISSADISIINFETLAVGNDKGFSGYPKFNSPVEVIEGIKEAGFNTINLNNNHILDRGMEGLIDTINNIKRNGLRILGVSEDGLESKDIIYRINDIDIGILSYSYGYNGNESMCSNDELINFVNKIEENQIKKDINKLVDKVDFIVVYIHWGDEYMDEPNKNQLELSEKIFNWGGNIILGSHPHIIQKGELLNKDSDDKYIIYSMGNFISNQRREYMGIKETEDGVIVKLQLKKYDNGKKEISNVEYIPTWTYKYFNGKDNYEIIPIDDALKGNIELYDFESIKKELEDSRYRTIKKLNKI